MLWLMIVILMHENNMVVEIAFRNKRSMLGGRKPRGMIDNDDPVGFNPHVSSPL